MIEAFVGDEYFGADRSVILKERMGTTVKTMQKMSADAKAAVRIEGEPFRWKGPKKSRPGKGYGAKRQEKEGGSFPLGFGGIEK